MNKHMRRVAEEVSKNILTEEEYESYKELPFFDEGHGYDIFGFEKESGMLSVVMGKFLYEKYFRVESFGRENIPKKTRGMLVCNHSGIVPIDGAMIFMDCLLKLKPPRAIRAVVDRFFMGFPFVGMLLRRMGQINGMKRDFQELLRREELTLVFPEGTHGVGKHFSQRYKLERFGVGFLEIALSERTPLIPTCVVGAEEQAPMIFNIKPLARLLGFPYFPVTPTFPHLGPLGIFPLPVKYRIYYGEPLYLHEKYSPDIIDNPAKIMELVEEVKSTVQQMINKGLEERAGIFV